LLQLVVKVMTDSQCSWQVTHKSHVKLIVIFSRPC